jgi:hypothetical protein
MPFQSTRQPASFPAIAGPFRAAAKTAIRFHQSRSSNFPLRFIIFTEIHVADSPNRDAILGMIRIA